MYIQQVKKLEVSVPSDTPMSPVIEEASNELLVCAHALVSAYVCNGKVRRIEAIKGVRRLSEAMDGKMWGLKFSKYFVDDIYYDSNNSARILIMSLFYVEPDPDFTDAEE
jgi:hypothetical protein